MATTPSQPTIKSWYDDYMKASAPSYGILASSKPASSTQQLNPKDYEIKTEDAQATNWNVDKNQTVQGLIGGIIGQDSPLMQQAATTAKQQAASRGLGNSSIAIGAGQNAVYNAAMPIATTDAATYSNAAKYNADAANSMATFNAQAKNAAASQSVLNALEAARANQSISSDEYKQRYDAWAKANMQQADAGGQFVRQQADAASRYDLQKMDANTRVKLADMEAKWRQGMQTSASMAQTYQSMVDNVARVMASPDLDGPAKQAAIDNLTSLFNNNMKAQEAISGLKLGSLLNFGETKPEAKPPEVKLPPTQAKPTAKPQPAPNYNFDQYADPSLRSAGY